MRTPPGVSEADYRGAVAEFAQVVGTEWVFTSDEDLDLYRDAYSPFLNEAEELRGERIRLLDNGGMRHRRTRRPEGVLPGDLGKPGEVAAANVEDGLRERGGDE